MGVHPTGRSRRTMKRQDYEIGMIGLGVMGRNLLLNMADHGFSVAGYDKDPSKVEALRQESKERDIRGAENIQEFIGLLRPPRAVIMLVPAGAPVDSVINDLQARLQPGDLDHRRGQLLLQGHAMCAPATWRKKAFISSASGCPAARKARVTGRASCPAVRKRRTSGSGRSSKPPLPGKRRSMRRLARSRIRRALRQDGS